MPFGGFISIHKFESFVFVSLPTSLLCHFHLQSVYYFFFLPHWDSLSTASAQILLILFPGRAIWIPWVGETVLRCGGGSLVAKSSPTLATSWTVSHQAPLSVGFPRHGLGLGWNGLPFPFPGYLLNPGIKPTSLVSPALQADSLPLRHQRSSQMWKWA